MRVSEAPAEGDALDVSCKWIVQLAPFGTDSDPPPRIGHEIETVGVRKAGVPSAMPQPLLAEHAGIVSEPRPRAGDEHALAAACHDVCAIGIEDIVDVGRLALVDPVLGADPRAESAVALRDLCECRQLLGQPDFAADAHAVVGIAFA